METHSSILAWRLSLIEESIGSQESDKTEHAHAELIYNVVLVQVYSTVAQLYVDIYPLFRFFPHVGDFY